jgi:6-phosphofructokinase 1
MAQSGNFLVIQSGGPTPVINRSLYGVFDEASKQSGVKVLGAINGIEGLLQDNIVDLGEISPDRWVGIASMPSASLGSSRRSLNDEDGSSLIEVLKRHNIRFCHIIGGNDSAENGHRINTEINAMGYEIAVVNVPKTIDNDLVLTDHCPGFGSAARFIALATMGSGLDAEAMKTSVAGTIIEVMGRDSGWLAAASVLGKREESDPPHVLGVPEVPIDEQQFMDRMDQARTRFGFAVAVIAENSRGIGGVIGGQQEPWYVDDFGHEYYEGPSRYFARELSLRIGQRVRYEVPGTIQRSFTTSVSEVDANEAEAVGRAAVRFALKGETDKIVNLVRISQMPYRVEFRLEPLQSVAGRVREMPASFLDRVTSMPTDAFADYALPLLGDPLPDLKRIR